MTHSRYLTLALLVVLLGGTLRTLWLRADPPVGAPGIVWHDEGAWTHNARNRALWGTWRTDQWNPVFVAPAFTALEYAAFRTFGVGLWQARTVPVASGLLALVLLMAGLSAVGGRRAAVIGGVLLATDYGWVMWNRAALMESTMTAFLVVAWAAYAMAGRRAVWGFIAGVATVLAFFTKASAAFFVAALAADALATLAIARLPDLRARLGVAAPSTGDVRGAAFSLIGLAVAFGAIGATFVGPHWADYQFYNVQVSVLRKPSYDLATLVTNASWLPVASEFFTRSWLVLVGAALAILGLLARWRAARPAERLLVLWVLVGLLELIVHDSGDERYYVMLIPALIALAALVASSNAPVLPAGLAATRTFWRRLVALPVLLLLAYLVFGSLLRLAFLSDLQLEVGRYKGVVRVSATLAALASVGILLFWSRLVSWLSARRLPAVAAAVLVGVTVIWNLAQYERWAADHHDFNYQASVALGRLLPPGTLVHGKLANGMALDNQIRPIFIGRGFGNYDDRFDRDDVRYILTYDLPEIGYESQQRSGMIQEVLDRYPNRRTVATFEVDETPGPDRAVLIDKHPGSPPPAVSGIPRARD